MHQLCVYIGVPSVFVVGCTLREVRPVPTFFLGAAV